MTPQKCELQVFTPNYLPALMTSGNIWKPNRQKLLFSLTLQPAFKTGGTLCTGENLHGGGRLQLKPDA